MNISTLADSSYQHRLKEAWGHFVENRDYDYSFMRSEILESWKRARNTGINPRDINYKNLSPDELNMKINKNLELINIVHPHLESIYSIVEGSGSYILLCDSEGYVIDYKGDPDIIERGGLTKLGLGSVRDERSVGTNGIGTALYLEKPVQIWGEEHYAEKHKSYTCSGAPFFDANDNLCGCINITVLTENAHPHTLGMALCAADSITKELKLRQAMNDLEAINAQRNSIIENMTSGVILLNSLRRVSQVNKYALNLFHLSYEDIIGQKLFDYITIDNYDSYTIHDILKTERYNEEVSVFMKLSPSRPKRLNLSINHVKDSSGNITGTIMRFNKPEMLNKIVKSIGGFSAKYTFSSIVGRSEPMQRMIQTSRKAAQNDSNVLILGESGTGKELIAQSIHNASPVAGGPFVAINCAAIPNSLVESELFGYEKGAFTGAEKEGRPGKFEMADGGTIFLDEIGDMPYAVQAALLRVLQTKEVVRVGGKYPKPVNIRVIAATNQDLTEAVAQKTFREDLFYRLNVLTIAVPPLRDRGADDISLLISHFVDMYNKKRHTDITVAPEVYQVLKDYSWPGNVRQLENTVERAISLCSDDIITCEDLPPQFCDMIAAQNSSSADTTTGNKPGSSAAGIARHVSENQAGSSVAGDPRHASGGSGNGIPAGGDMRSAYSANTYDGADSAGSVNPADSPNTFGSSNSAGSISTAGSPNNFGGMNSAGSMDYSGHPNAGDTSSFRNPGNGGADNSSYPNSANPDHLRHPDAASYNIAENEAALIISALEKCSGNVTASAELLSMNLRTLYRKIKKHEINVDLYRRRK